MNEIKSNSYKSREQERENKKEDIIPISSQAKVKNKSWIRKLVGAIISDNVQNFQDYFINDVLAPAISDALHSTIDGLLKTNKSSRGNRDSRGRVVTRYNDMYVSDDERSKRKQSSANVYDYRNLEYDSYAEADYVLKGLKERLEKYEAVSVGEYYEYSNLTGKPVDYKWGWYQLRGAYVYGNNKDGYFIELPKAVPLD